MRQRKVRLDRGDTLGGTVPLVLRDRVTADFKTGSIHRRRNHSRFSSGQEGGVFGVGSFVALLLLLTLIGIPLYTWLAEPMALRDWVMDLYALVSTWILDLL